MSERIRGSYDDALYKSTYTLLYLLTVDKAPKSCHVTPILRSLQWLRICIECITYLQSSHNLHTFITSSPFNVLAVLALRPSLLLLGHLALSCLWNQLTLSLRQSHSGTSSSISDPSISSPITSSSSDSPHCTSIIATLFYSRLKTYLFHKSYPPKFHFFSRTDFTGYCLGRFF